MKRTALSYWIIGLMGAALFGIHVWWWLARPEQRSEVISGFGAALIVLGIWIAARPYIRTGVHGTAQAQIQAPQFPGYGDSSGQMYADAQNVTQAKIEALKPDVWDEKVFGVLAVLLGTVLNGYGALIARMIDQMTTASVLTAPNVGAVAGILSAFFWIWSALMNVPWHKLGVLSGPRLDDLKPFQRQSLLNGIAAFLSAIAAGCTSYILWSPK